MSDEVTSRPLDDHELGGADQAERELLDIATGAGMDSDGAAQLVVCHRAGRRDQTRCLLAAHRMRLLDDLHANQENLYRIDYLIRKYG